MALGIRNGLLVLTAICHLPEKRAGLPILIAELLDALNPIVGDVHGHAIVKSITTVGNGCSQSGHTAHFLCNGNGILVHLVDELVCQSKIADGVVILMAIEIVAVSAEGLSQSVAVIEH